jgi:hypothetical protein
MSLSEIVDANYRIHVEDLHGQEREWRISNVSFQGVEEMTPVLHFEEMTKRLVLDQELSLQMIELARTAIPEEWLGAKIRIAPNPSSEGSKMSITAAKLPRPVARDAARRTKNWLARFLLAGAIIVVIFAIAQGLAQFGSPL